MALIGNNKALALVLFALCVGGCTEAVSSSPATSATPQLVVTEEVANRNIDGMLSPFRTKRWQKSRDRGLGTGYYAQYNKWLTRTAFEIGVGRMASPSEVDFFGVDIARAEAELVQSRSDANDMDSGALRMEQEQLELALIERNLVARFMRYDQRSRGFAARRLSTAYRLP